MAYDYINDTGIIVPDTTTLRDEVVSEWQTALGADITTTADTPQGVLITAEALAREGVVNNNAQLANQINPNLAGGVFLDAICALMGIERRAASRSILTGVQLFGSPATNVPAGSRAMTSTGDVWTLQSSVVIGAGGVVTGTFVCTATGPIACTPGQLNQVVDMVLGWEGVTNPTAATQGTNQESDAELASRRQVTLARQGISTREAQISGLYDVDGVTSVAFRENVASTNQTIDGVAMVPHSIWACVDGTFNRADIAESLMNNKTDGAAFNGTNASVNYTDPYSGQIYVVKFDVAVRTAVNVSIRVRVGRGEQANPLTVIPQAIADWAAGKIPQDEGLQIGTDVTAFEVSGAVNYFYPGFQVTAVSFSVGGVPVVGNTVDIDIKHRAIILAKYVTVTVVS